MRCRLVWLAVLAALLTSRWATAQTLDEQLRTWQQAQERTSYQGSFVYERNGVFSTHRVWRQAAHDGLGRERFLRLNGSRLDALREDGRLRCMTHPYRNRQLEALSEPLVPQRRFDIQQVSTNYRIERVGYGRIADRDTEVVLFAPLDVHRYPLEIHFDRETGVVLQSLLLNEQGELLERFQFVNFVLGEQTDEQLQVAGCEQVKVEVAGEHTKDALPDWHVGWLPEGFVPVGQQGLSGHTFSQLFFDGLAHFSVFVAAVDESLLDMEYRQVGPTVVMSRPVEVGGQHYMVTVLGEVPVVTAQRIVLSVSLAAGHD